MSEILFDFTRPLSRRIAQACEVCHGWGKLYEDADGYLFVTCPGPCNGSGFTDLPIQEVSGGLPPNGEA